MFKAMLSAVRADIDRQVGWAQGEVRRQIRYVALLGAVAGMAALAAVGALVVGLVALHSWLAMQVGSRAALGIIGAGLLVLTLVLVLAGYVLRRPSVGAPPKLQIARPAALLGAFGQSRSARAIAGGEDSFRLAASTLRDGSRSQLLSALALIAILGVIAGRRLRRVRPVEK